MIGDDRAATVVTALPLTEEEDFVADAARHGMSVVRRCSTSVELFSAIEQHRPRWVAAIARPEYLDHRVVAACDAVGARLLVGATSLDEQRHARDLGLPSILPRPLRWPAPDALEARLVPAAPSRGRITVVWGTDGAPGRSSIAANLATEFAIGGERVVLADADTRAACQALALGLLDEAPGFAAACRLAGIGSLSHAELDRLADHYPLRQGSLRVLTGIVRASRWTELGADRVTGVLEEARGWVDRVVVDTSAGAEVGEEVAPGRSVPGRDDATLAALRAADDIVLVGAADPVGAARLIRSHAALRDLVGDHRVTVVVNKLRASALGVAPELQVRQSLERFAGIVDPAFVAWDPAAFDAALLRARPLAEVAPRSPATAQLRALARERLGAVVPTVAAPTRDRHVRRRAGPVA